MASNLENDVDFISSMPDPILQLILQGLPNTEEVVRTSVLSTRWRYLWTSIPYFPSLNFDCDRLLSPSMTYSRAKKLSDFVSWALAKEKVDLDSFRLSCASYYRSSVVKRWIKAAVNRKVKSLDLMYDPEDTPYCVIVHSVHYLPDCLIMCESLESLRLLFIYRSPISVPICTGFVVLKVLELNNVYFFLHDSIEKFLKKCPVLEELSLIDCAISKCGPIYISSTKLRTLIICNLKNHFSRDYPYVFCGLKVSCPKLVSFEYVGLRGEVILEDVNSLKKAVIHPNDMLQRKVSPTSGKAVSKLLAGISHVDSLSLNLYFIQCVYATHYLNRKGPATFPNLKTLELTASSDAFTMSVIIGLLKCSPNLESFHLIIQKCVYATLDPNRKFPASFPNLKTLELTASIDAFTMSVIIRLLKCSPNLESFHMIIRKEHLRMQLWALNKVESRSILTRHLKTVKFLGFNGEKPKLGIARLLLEHGKALEEMVFSWHNKVKYDEKSMMMMTELSKFQKASSTVKLVSHLQD